MLWKIVDFTINLIPVISTLKIWVQKLFNVKLVAFLVLKGILFFLFYKFLPVLFGRLFQWIYDLSADTVDLSYLSSVLVSPQITGLPAWLFYQLKLDVCFRILITGATIRLGLKRLPFMSN
jgi:hypothetical protein